MSTTTEYERTLLLTDTADTAALTALAERRGWRLDFVQPFSDGVSQRVWVVEAGDRGEHGEEPVTLVRELQHHRHGTRFVSVSGPDAGTVRELAAAVRRTLETTALDTVLEGLCDDRTAPVELVRGLRLLLSAHFMSCLSGTLSDGPLDARHTEAFARLLRHPTTQVRLTAMLVIDHLRPIAPQLATLVLARQGVERELDDLVDAFVTYARQAGGSTADAPS